MINAIVFDVDDTLYDQQQPFRNAVKKILPFFRETDLAALYLRFRHHSDENFGKVLHEEWSLIEFRHHRICHSLMDLGYPLISEQTALIFQEAYEAELDNIKMHPQITKTLNYLTSLDLTLGIITNGPTDHQAKKIQQLQISNWIAPENILISQATGFQKPEIELFQLAEAQFSLNPENTLYVGDNFDNDVIGAKNAGWQTLWCNHRLRSIPEESPFQADWEASNFAECRRLIIDLIENPNLISV